MTDAEAQAWHHGRNTGLADGHQVSPEIARRWADDCERRIQAAIGDERHFWIGRQTGLRQAALTPRPPT